MRGRSLDSSPSPRIGGEQLRAPIAEHCGGMASGVIVVLGSLLAVLGACPYPVAPVGGVVIAVEVRSALC